MNPLAPAIIGLIRVYQWCLSPFIPASCRYLPTCSQYAVEAIARHGPAAGGWLALRRLLRCHPWGGSGLDPVPERTGARARLAHQGAGWAPPCPGKDT